MNIQILSIHSSPLGKLGTRDTGGMSVYIFETAKIMGSLGHCVDVFTLGQKSTGIPTIQPLAENVRLINLELEIQENLTKENLFEYLPMVYNAYNRQIDLMESKYDLIHSHYWLSGHLGMMIQNEYKLPHFVSFHTLGKIKNIACGDEYETDVRISQEKVIAAACDSVIAFTQEEKRNLQIHYGVLPGNICVIPCGVDRELFKPIDLPRMKIQAELTADDKILLYVGRNVPIKGLGKLLYALAKLARKYSFKCLIVGGEDEVMPGVVNIQSYIDELALGENIIRVGSIPQEELPLYYNAADVLVVPSLHESFGLVVLESLSCGTPVIGSAVGIIPEVINTDNGRIVATGDIAELAEAIEEIILTPVARKVEKAEIRQSVSQYGWDSVATQLLAAYSQENSDFGGL